MGVRAKKAESKEEERRKKVGSLKSEEERRQNGRREKALRRSTLSSGARIKSLFTCVYIEERGPSIIQLSRSKVLSCCSCSLCTVRVM